MVLILSAPTQIEHPNERGSLPGAGSSSYLPEAATRKPAYIGKPSDYYGQSC